MQPSKLKTIGAVLLLSAVIGALFLQAIGFGLVTHTDFNPPHIRTTTVQGATVVITETHSTVLHLKRVAPIAALFIAGIVCILMAPRNNPSKTR